ncbi:MAG TPA: hypothetical protein VIN04_09980 [Myxococcota bacterium]
MQGDGVSRAATAALRPAGAPAITLLGGSAAGGEPPCINHNVAPAR